MYQSSVPHSLESLKFIKLTIPSANKYERQLGMSQDFVFNDSSSSIQWVDQRKNLVQNILTNINVMYTLKITLFKKQKNFHLKTTLFTK